MTVPSDKTFLFSLSAFKMPNSPKVLQVLASKREEAITRTTEKAPYFGGAKIEDLSIRLDGAAVKVNLSNAYESPSDPLAFFTGASETNVDEVEVLILGGWCADKGYLYDLVLQTATTHQHFFTRLSR